MDLDGIYDLQCERITTLQHHSLLTFIMNANRETIDLIYAQSLLRNRINYRGGIKNILWYVKGTHF